VSAPIVVTDLQVCQSSCRFLRDRIASSPSNPDDRTARRAMNLRIFDEQADKPVPRSGNPGPPYVFASRSIAVTLYAKYTSTISEKLYKILTLGIAMCTSGIHILSLYCPSVPFRGNCDHV